MGRRGPPPKPSALRALEGNPGKRAVNHKEPKPPAVVPPCPKELPDAAKKEWRRISKVLAPLGLLTEMDLAALAAYCTLYARWLEAEDKVRELGMLVKSPNGYPMQSPYLNIAQGALKQMRGYLQEFGLSPAARSRVTVEEPEREDEFGKFLKEKNGRRSA